MSGILAGRSVARRSRFVQAGALTLLLSGLQGAVGARGAEQARDPSPAANELIADARPEEAIELLDKALKRRPDDARALLLRSTAYFMLGKMVEGKRDLDRAITLDPANRQAWLNRAGLEVAQEDYEAALRSFGRAETLDPAAAENSLNIGAVLLLLDRFDQARDRFKDYLARNPSDPEARYLVASNYAMRGFAQPALANLSRAIALDEKIRRRARTDPNFAPLGQSASYQDLLKTDSFRLAPGSMIRTQSYKEPYLAGQSSVLDAVISSLQLAQRAFDPRVEVTPGWALVWSDARIKVSDDGDGGTRLEMSAPPKRFSPAEWQEFTEELFRNIKVQLHARGRRQPGS